MGLTMSTVWNRLVKFGGAKERRLIMVGLDAAGKTTILYKMKLNETVTTIPTIGFNVETLEYKTLKMNVWDIGGQDKIRALWKYYYQNTDAIIYVVDSADRERVRESADELRKLLNESELEKSALLVFANKQDLPGAMSVAELSSELGLMDLRNRKWFIQACCAASGDGLFNGLDWLANSMSK